MRPGRAMERTIALGIAIGAGYLFPTTFEKEVFSDLTGERGVLMGALAGVMEAQYNVLRKYGHSPSEAFNETVEELTQSLIRLVDKNGQWIGCTQKSAAQLPAPSALDWRHEFPQSRRPGFSMRCTRAWHPVSKTSNCPQGEQCARITVSSSTAELREMREVEDVGRRARR